MVNVLINIKVCLLLIIYLYCLCFCGDTAGTYIKRDIIFVLYKLLYFLFVIYLYMFLVPMDLYLLYTTRNPCGYNAALMARSVLSMYPRFYKTSSVSRCQFYMKVVVFIIDTFILSKKFSAMYK